MPSFRRVLIANRGAVARRIGRTLHGLGIETIAVFSEADADAPWVREADEAWALEGNSPAQTYLDIERLVAIQRASGADAVHPGYGFLAESAAFARAVTAAGGVFIGPRDDLLETFSDKVRARRTMQAAGLVVGAGSDALPDAEAAVRAAEAIGYPVVLKPLAGGGGIGMQVATDADALRAAFGPTTRLAQAAFGDDSVYLERFRRNPRHVEFQVAADGNGGWLLLGERDCSVQRRHQKLVEEAPAPGLDPAEVRARGEQAAAALAATGYCGIGTVEMLHDADDGWSFLEVNPRLQVEHAVTEAVTGTDLVALQVRLARGEGLDGTSGSAVRSDGAAIEARVLAEDPDTLLPSPGRLDVFRPPAMRHVRVETGHAEGMTVSVFYDPLLAKVIAHGDTRARAIGRLLVALKAFEIRGVRSNLPLLIRILEDRDFIAGRVHTGLVDHTRGARRI